MGDIWGAIPDGDEEARRSEDTAIKRAQSYRNAS